MKPGKGQRQRELRPSWAQLCQGGCAELFAGVSPKARSRLEETLFPVRYKEGDLIFQTRAYAAGIYLVSQGLIRYGRRLEGRRHIIRLIGPGELIGLESLFMEGQPTRQGYAKALTAAEVSFIERGLLLELLPAEPALALGFCQRLTQEIIFLEYKLTGAVCRTIEENLALLLLSLGHKYGIKQPQGLYIGVELKRATMADILGISLESLMRALRKLRRRKILRFEGRKIIIHDRRRLAELARLAGERLWGGD